MCGTLLGWSLDFTNNHASGDRQCRCAASRSTGFLTEKRPKLAVHKKTLSKPATLREAFEHPVTPSEVFRLASTRTDDGLNTSSAGQTETLNLEPKLASGGALLTADSAASYLGCSPATLEKWRVKGGGPRFIKMGRLVRYRLHDLDMWVNDRVRSSTADIGASRAPR
jgi:excisionase family DNA binding protein